MPNFNIKTLAGLKVEASKRFLEPKHNSHWPDTSLNSISP